MPSENTAREAGRLHARNLQLRAAMSAIRDIAEVSRDAGDGARLDAFDAIKTICDEQATRGWDDPDDGGEVKLVGLQETASYLVQVTLSNEAGELPIDAEVEAMIFHQMGGELDELTGLKCIGVHMYANLTTGVARDNDSDL